MKLLFLTLSSLIICSALIGCGPAKVEEARLRNQETIKNRTNQNVANTNGEITETETANAPGRGSVRPFTPEERAKHYEEETKAKSEAITSFLADTYPGWQYIGKAENEDIAGYVSPYSGTVFDLYLKRDKERKIITVAYRKFYDDEYNNVLIAYEINRQELIGKKTAEIEER